MKVDRLGSGVWVSASFQIFAVIGGGMFLCGVGNCLAARNSPGEYVRSNVQGKCHTVLYMLYFC